MFLRLCDIHLLIFIEAFKSCFKVLNPILLTRTLRPLIILLNPMLLLLLLVQTLIGLLTLRTSPLKLRISHLSII